jgi:membrane protease YdiL (CAAX protease family)
MHEAPSEFAPPSALAPPARLPTSPVAPWWHTALIVLLLGGGSVLNAHQAHQSGLDAHHMQRYLGGIAAEWILFLLVWWGLRLRRVSLASLIGLRRGWQALGDDLGAAAIFWMLSLMVLTCLGLALQKLNLGTPQKTLAALAPQSAVEMLLWIALSVSAGFVEELVFRGYFLRQFTAPFARVAVGVVASSLLFGCVHAYEGAAGMIAIAAYGALFCGLALLRGTLRPGMIAHAWHDIFSGAMLALLHHAHLL